VIIYVAKVALCKQQGIRKRGRVSYGGKKEQQKRKRNIFWKVPKNRCGQRNKEKGRGKEKEREAKGR
jgi:hypothetical protein